RPGGRRGRRKGNRRRSSRRRTRGPHLAARVVCAGAVFRQPVGGMALTAARGGRRRNRPAGRGRQREEDSAKGFCRRGFCQRGFWQRGFWHSSFESDKERNRSCETGRNRGPRWASCGWRSCWCLRAVARNRRKAAERSSRRGRLAPVLSHHLACGSAPGGSEELTKCQATFKHADQPLRLKISGVKGVVQVGCCCSVILSGCNCSEKMSVWTGSRSP